MFTSSKNSVIKTRQNFGCPDSMREYQNVPATDYKRKTITIKECVVVNKPKKDRDTKDYIRNKNGDIIYQPITYISFNEDGEDKFFATSSKVLVEQLAKIEDKQLVYYEDKTIVCDTVAGQKCKIGSMKVKYRDGQEYDNLILEDA